MGMMWYPGQDVDFMKRLSNVEKVLQKLAKSYEEHNLIKQSSSPYSVHELEAENAELRIRVDDLEELVLTLSQELGDLQERV